MAIHVFTGLPRSYHLDVHPLLIHKLTTDSLQPVGVRKPNPSSKSRTNGTQGHSSDLPSIPKWPMGEAWYKNPWVKLHYKSSIQACQPQSGAIVWDCIWGNFWLNDNIYEIGENGAKISSISHSNGPILVGQLRESHAEILRVGRPASIKHLAWQVVGVALCSTSTIIA